MEECRICCEVFNNRTHQKVACAKCSGIACRLCIQTYILDSIEDRCMMCEHPWDAEFLRTFCSTNWLNGPYRSRKQERIFEAERSRLPEFQYLVDNHNIYKGLEGRLREAKTEMRECRKRASKLGEEVEVLEEEFARSKRNLFRRAVDTPPQSNPSEHEASGSKPVVSFLSQCPQNECRGFLDRSHKCGVCKFHACPQCLTAWTPDHHCNTEDVESIKLLKRDTRSCPRCHTGIFKISGCDQMFCTICHTAFSYRTGCIDTKTIHNPHYFEWQNQQRRAARWRAGGDVGCNQLPENLYAIWDVFNVTEDDKDAKVVCKMLNRMRQVILHIDLDVLPRKLNLNAIENELMQLRLDYFLGTVDEETWKKKLYIVDKKRERYQALRHAYGLIVDVAPSMFYPKDAQLSSLDMSLQARADLVNLFKFSKTNVENVCSRFKCAIVYELPTFCLA